MHGPVPVGWMGPCCRPNDVVMCLLTLKASSEQQLPEGWDVGALKRPRFGYLAGSTPDGVVAAVTWMSSGVAQVSERVLAVARPGALVRISGVEQVEVGDNRRLRDVPSSVRCFVLQGGASTSVVDAEVLRVPSVRLGSAPATMEQPRDAAKRKDYAWRDACVW
jgi:hypothetical protein